MAHTLRFQSLVEYAMIYEIYLQFSSDAGTGVPGRGWTFVYRPRAGFTLLELLVVLTVIGIFTTIVIPRVDVARFQLDAAMQEVASAVAAARGKAILRQHDYVLTFDVVGDRFHVLDDANNNGTMVVKIPIMVASKRPRVRANARSADWDASVSELMQPFPLLRGRAVVRVASGA